jgi:hypothetical protein
MHLTTQHPGGATFGRLCDGNAKLQFIDTRKDTGPFLKALVESASGKTLLAYTTMLSFNKLVELWSQATRQPAKHRQVTVEES